MPIILGDCVDELNKLEENSIDSIVTDPPYGLKFMGKEFDDLGVGAAQREWHKAWAAEALRVLKPGGYLLAFGGSRTYHHLASAIEEVGFEVRDQIMWIYGSGFPKSSNVSKQIDKAAGADREVLGIAKGVGDYDGGRKIYEGGKWQSNYEVTGSATDEAKQWDGWGTALKPAHEPIVMARKPFKGAAYKNVLEHGTGALNIDDCRIGENAGWSYPNGAGGSEPNHMQRGEKKGNANAPVKATKGRWPSNVIMDEFISSELEKSKFFYCAKPSKKEKGSENNHPTVKPIELISYLQRLVTPPQGITLDPFLGSGTAAIAASLEDFEFIGIEKDKDYYDIAISRIEMS